MRYQILATDYDGTLAHNGVVDAPTIAALKNLLATGRRLVLVTGRELPQLQITFPHLDLFEWVVAENGALLYHPATKEELLLAEPPPARFSEALRANGCEPLSVGRVVVATYEPHQQLVLKTIQNFGLELQIIFNKGAVMVLPAGVNKASGLTAALKEMGLSPHNAVGVGDAENDQAMLKLCEFSAAVSNALTALKEAVDWVTPAGHGQGVAQLIERMIASDLADLDGKLTWHHLELGVGEDGPVCLPPYGPSVLIAGPSASGKSTVATQIVETLVEGRYQFCLIDPEGDYENFEQAVVLGGPKAAPQLGEVLRVLENPEASVVVSMTGMPIPDRPPFFLKLLPQLLQMRAQLGRPHWLILDEAHHLLPAEWLPPKGMLPDELISMVLITVHPDLLSAAILERLDTLLAIGPEAADILQHFAQAGKTPMPIWKNKPPAMGEVLHWTRAGNAPPQVVKTHPCQQERRRHQRKYAEGELPPERSFYFQGPEKKLNLRAQNLILFLQLADGVDDATWEHHRRAGDYSRWLKGSIKDADLAAEVACIEAIANIDPLEGRRQIRVAIERDYTLPATGPLPVPGANN
ncbi:MAG: HAD-IIB family hydrolase [Proteobacteria bacterium]|nr:HAD-IIB family hydrolase [Pseudomonadota bacterium]MBU4294685.1 HAD-IIB family hydrolase [Pseudomonadota bacterium]MCG2748597.1 HAD-IIB family hydrolase [Desulfobulbaceae bacterium]